MHVLYITYGKILHHRWGVSLVRGLNRQSQPDGDDKAFCCLWYHCRLGQEPIELAIEMVRYQKVLTRDRLTLFRSFSTWWGTFCWMFTLISSSSSAPGICTSWLSAFGIGMSSSSSLYSFALGVHLLSLSAFCSLLLSLSEPQTHCGIYIEISG